MRNLRLCLGIACLTYIFLHSQTHDQNLTNNTLKETISYLNILVFCQNTECASFQCQINTQQSNMSNISTIDI